jgi:hypothetical protein
MAGHSTRHLSHDKIQADHEALQALKNIGDYAPPKPAYSVACHRTSSGVIFSSYHIPGPIQ